MLIGDAKLGDYATSITDDADTIPYGDDSTLTDYTMPHGDDSTLADYDTTLGHGSKFGDKYKSLCDFINARITSPSLGLFSSTDSIAAEILPTACCLEFVYTMVCMSVECL